MRLNNKGFVLAACMAVTSCGGADRPQLTYAPPGGDVPPPSAGGTPYPDPVPLPPQRNPVPAPLSADEMDAAPPLSAGPSGTSDRDAGRYDEVGYATWYGNELAGSRTASGTPFNPQAFTAAHRTLPLGSYAEVTSLQTGRTILVLVNDRGPQQSNLLIDLSQAAAQALGIQGRGAVRIRRVTATPADIAAIRAGQPGAPRLDTPPGLLVALRQRMGPPIPGLPGARVPVRPPVRIAPEPQAAKAPPPQVARAPVRAVPAPGKAPASAGGYYVQVAAFSSQQRAAALAKSLGGSAVSSGSVWRVRLGPYATQNQASQARDGAAARGYGDARIVRED